MIQKILWGMRAVLLVPFFQYLGLPTYIGKPVFISGAKRISLGKRVRIFPGIRIETHGDNAAISIKNNVAIGQNVHITAMGKLLIDEGSTILGNVFITDIEHSYTEIGKPVFDQTMLYRKTEIGKNCMIGYGAAIQAGTILGEQCIVGANAVVRGVFPPYSVIVGVPAKIIKQYDFNTNTWKTYELPHPPPPHNTAE
jgi:acetyltransferase-like isoleucine patch superfamily enzyme